MTWRVLLTPPASGVRNMALDGALLDRARATGEGVVRVYTWSTPTISFGRHQKALGTYDAEKARRARLDVVRRITGGRALVHAREITYSVTAPDGRGDDLRSSYRQVNSLLTAALMRLGVPVVIANGGRRLGAPGVAPCFELPAEGELTWRGRKLVGSAQVREGGAWLQHGSILLDDDQARLLDAATEATLPLTPAATLREALGRSPSADEFAEALFAEVRSTWDAAARVLPLDAALDVAARQYEAQYADDAWTWRA